MTRKSNDQEYIVTRHATERMQRRAASRDALRATLQYGRETYIHGALRFSLGRKEIQRWLQAGIDLRDHEGLHVITDGAGAILTVYKNHNFRGLRPRARRHWPISAGTPT